jgi:hypothetical protein
MPELDGNWQVTRTGGLLPPLTGVRKTIHGRRGSTHVRGVAGVSFDVVGLELHYSPRTATASAGVRRSTAANSAGSR